MGRVPEGWKVVWRGRATRRGYVRFRWGGARIELATGQRDPGAAAAAAAEIYADVVSGRRLITKRARGSSTAPPAPQQLLVEELLAEWLVAMEATHARRTVGLFKTHAFAHFTRWRVLAEVIQPGALAEYMRARLRLVTRHTVGLELGSLKLFLSWCVERGFLPGLPLLPELPKGALGRRDPRRKEQATDLSAEEIEAWLAALPEATRTPMRAGPWKGRRFPVRDWFTLAWETALRPATLGALEVPRHYQPGSDLLHLTRDIDKARFQRPVPLTARAREILDRHAPAQGVIFGSYSLRGYMKPAGVASGLAPEKVATLSPYDMRHARGTHLVGETGDISGTAYLLGHKMVTTTDRYAKGRLRHARSVLEQIEAAGDSGEDSGEREGSGGKK